LERLLINYTFIFGVFAAFLHVLSGPDHLAAIGPIALNDHKRSWIIGLFWAIGHTSGMLIIGILFIYFKEYIPVELISKHSEQLVGIMLIIIGIWAFYRLFKLSYFQYHTSHRHTHKRSEKGDHAVKRSPYIPALSIGILHGLAGVSHFLGVLPTLAFESAWQSAIYLSGFALGTIIAMVIFSFIMGYIGSTAKESKRTDISKWINGLAGSISIYVGIIWIVHTGITT
jgi:sulfite exporter TauE/SafE